jgi:hypothetical protein
MIIYEISHQTNTEKMPTRIVNDISDVTSHVDEMLDDLSVGDSLRIKAVQVEISDSQEPIGCGP